MLPNDDSASILSYFVIGAGIPPLCEVRQLLILLNGVIGYSVAILFVVFRAPDLALTQIIVESVTTALFLLCFYYLPEWDETKGKTTKDHISMLIIAIAVGSIVTILALWVGGNKLFEIDFGVL